MCRERTVGVVNIPSSIFVEAKWYLLLWISGRARKEALEIIWLQAQTGRDTKSISGATAILNTLPQEENTHTV